MSRVRRLGAHDHSIAVINPSRFEGWGLSVAQPTDSVAVR